MRPKTASFPTVLLSHASPTVQIITISIDNAGEVPEAFSQYWMDCVDWTALEAVLFALFRGLKEVRITAEDPMPPFLCKQLDGPLPEPSQVRISQAMPRLHAESILRFPRPAFNGYA